jgi:hypothetical protein
MNTKEKHTDRSHDANTRPSTRHIYHLRSGERPTTGHRALCGWIKQTPTMFPTHTEAWASNMTMCVVCADLDKTLIR